jgi:hypothetical protein
MSAPQVVKSRKIQSFATILVLVLLSLSTFPLSTQVVGLRTTPLSPQFASAISSSGWHEGTNQSTPEVDVNYSEMYGTGPNINTNVTLDRLGAYMGLGYNDGTGESVLFGVSYSFAPSGLDLSDDQVLNWSKVVDAGLTLQTQANVNGTSIGTMYTFTGFDIVNGGANDFSLTRNDLGNGNFTYSVNNIVGSINYANATSITIGAVSLSTANTTYNGRTLNESIARFNVTIDAQMSDLPLPPINPSLQNNSSSVSVPVVLMFEVTHDTAQTDIKYGVSVDWSSTKAFPTATQNNSNPNATLLVPNALKTGDNFSLVAADRLSFAYGKSAGANTSYTYGTTFTTDPENDSAIYLVNGTQLCRELFPTNYTITGSSQTYNTTRVYVPISFQTTWNESSMFVVFGGFQYNESSGFSFDPSVITPNSVSNSVSQQPTFSSSASVTGSSSPSSTASKPSTSNSPPNPIMIVIPVVVILAAIAAGAVIALRRKK